MIVRTSLLAMALTTAGCASLANALILFPTQNPLHTDATRLMIPTRQPILAGNPLEAYYEEFGPEGEVELYILALTGNAGRAERMLPTPQS